ncbi:MAG: 30S ribosome-binding factor RbfA [Candidatus Hydrogenedentes bacterium]|nr:30S ribosome-binding factor RbfA [Candidatus Hydrogenedentota bacterium]
MTKKVRIERVAEFIREEIAKLLIDGIKDPRLGFVSVMKVRMSNDLRYADVYVSLYGDEKQRKSSLIALQNSAGWVKSMIAQNLHMRYIPDIRFLPDDSLERAYAMEEVFNKIHQERSTLPFLRLELSELIEEILSSNKIMITTHERPDGDALGSLIGLWIWLEQKGKEVIPLISAPVPKMYSFLPRSSQIRHLEEDKLPRWDFDTVIIVDVASTSRIGEVNKYVKPTHKVIVIDHHETLDANGLMGYANSSYSACGEIISEIYINTDVPFSKESAIALYVAIATDTGGFRFSNTTSLTHQITSTLLKTGLDLEEINTRIFESFTKEQFELLRRILSRTEFTAEGKVSYSSLFLKDFQETGATLEDCHNLTNFLRDIENVVVGVLFVELERKKTKVSLRSRKVFNSGEFMMRLGGGGHRCAAGGTLDMPIDLAKKSILAELESSLKTI